MQPVNLADAARGIDGHWKPRTVTTVNDYDVRLARIQGEFVRHRHPETDEFFLVLEGELALRLDDREVVLRTGEAYVVPAGVYHQPVAVRETSILMFEPRATVNTGDAGGPLTAPRDTLEP